MPSEKYLKLKLGNDEIDIDVNSDFPITFDYQLEDAEDFQDKKSSESIGMKIPATLHNQKVLNTFHNTSYEDTSENKYYSGIRKIIAEANGDEIFSGKAFPKKAIKKGGVPISYELNCFGNNGNWIVDLKDVTLYDILKKINSVFDKENIINSWNYDGTNENLPYVFAPVKYAGWLDTDDTYYDADNSANNRTGSDKNYHIRTFKPSISKYWTIYWAFQMLGYKVKSNFLDSEYYRRQVMLWTFGSFLTSEGTKYEIHKFLAKTKGDDIYYDFDGEGYVNLNVYDDTDSGCYDNNNTITGGDYTGGDIHGGGAEMKWKYNNPDYGPLEATFAINLFYDYKIDLNSEAELHVHWFKNGNFIQDDKIFDHTAPYLGTSNGADNISLWLLNVLVTNGDEITCKVWLRLKHSKSLAGQYVARCILGVTEFKLDYFRIPVGGAINFDAYKGLQNYKFIDFLRGEVDLFNLSIQTDTINMEVLIEPTHNYSTSNNLSIKNMGYFNGNIIDWTSKEDISEESTIEIYDDNAREFVFKFKDDSNDGALKIVQDRYKISLASGKYVFNDRFKAEKKVYENRFYSPTMHYLVDEFEEITGEKPQMICIVPENISNTSSSESQNTFLPKTAYYKGRISGVGGWRMKDQNGQIATYQDFPFMFAVNYKQGGENDPILSYCDEKIGIGAGVVGRGLLKRFFLQRLAIMNKGQWLASKFNLNNKDITNWYHQERIKINGELFELITIKSYNPIKNQSTQCILRKWIPVSKENDSRIYPSETSILTDAVEVLEEHETQDSTKIDKVFDTQYYGLKCLYADIPR